jgi:hypothetical protein
VINRWKTRPLWKADLGSVILQLDVLKWENCPRDAECSLKALLTDIYNGLSGPSSVILFHISTSEWEGSEKYLCENAIKISGFSDVTPCITDNCENIYHREKLRFQICQMFLIFLLMRRSYDEYKFCIYKKMNIT